MFLKRERTETDDIAIEKYIDVLQRSFTNIQVENSVVGGGIWSSC